MNKEKYLKELEKRLDMLSDEQKQEEIFRVSNEIDSGKVMNDLSIEVDAIYKKYKIKKSSKKKNTNTKEYEGVIKYLNNFVNSVKQNDYKANLIVIRDIIIILILVSIFKIPFIALETFTFSVFQNMIADKFYTIIHYIIEIIYIVFAVFTFLRIFSKRFKKEMKLD